MDCDSEISKIAFLFLAFGIIFGGYIANILPCQLQKFLKNNIYAHHVIGILIFFIFIMMEGGWEFTNKYDDLVTDWSNGNVLTSLIYALILHIVFVLTSKIKNKMSIILYSSLFILYFIHTTRLNKLLKNEINEKDNKKIINIEKIILVLQLILLIFAVSDYYIYQMGEYKENFSNFKFLLGDIDCDNINT